MDLQRVKNFIGNQWMEPQAGAYLQNLNPATAEPLSLIPDSDAKDIEAAVKAAQGAFRSWSQLPQTERSRYLNLLADGIEKRADEFARLESQDQGKPVGLARKMDIDRAILNFRFFAKEILQEDVKTFENSEMKSTVLRKPVGVAGLISPWNLPLYLLTWKIAPALACGNTVVCKPSEFTSMTAALLGQVILDVGLPSGVINLVFGLGQKAGEALVKHPKVPLISFTGGTETGRRIYRESAEHFKKISLELGGKNPNLIFADCDLDQAIQTSLRSSFLNQGEICLCGSRIYVEESILPQFLERFVAETQKLKVGDPSSSDTFMGALISEAHLKKVQSYIELAKKEGGKILTGGDRPKLPEKFSKGYFLNPTIITGLSQSSRCLQEEIFGPVVTISSFSSTEQAIEKANDVAFGLSATVWTKDLKKAQAVAEKLETGTVWVNGWLLRDLRVPFGGIKHSGLGREGGQYSFDFFTETTLMCVNKEGAFHE